MSFVSACCNTPPVQAEYTSIGKSSSHNGMDYYIVGDKGATKGAVICYDIFAYHPNIYQFADKISLTGIRVIIPDFLKGKPLTMADLADRSNITEFARTRGSWEQNRDMLKATLALLRSEGTTEIGSVGFCWGARLSLSALGEDCGIKAVSLVHPSMLTKEDFEKAKGPVLLLTSKDDPEFIDEFAIVKNGPFGGLSYQERFVDRVHGFCAARGDFTDPAVTKDVNRVIQLTSGFLIKAL
ncbi:hypothetical protein H4R20_007135 [Coemansia guatemalensis]|uniref:Dienelactone hydrolase domain-containing protein n=1 Tax=Coemansia guatemalensis TaxID=2761395 RepID=A0A9W8HSD0_9FUNG|nr:hypothetical protein H4R20_007135 [Coemansia guatemalensis]